MDKIGRNSPCTCGSGKKFKECCGGPNRATIEEAVQYATKRMRQHQHNEAVRKANFGATKSIIHCDYKNHKVVAIGNELMFIPQDATFHDFLDRYLCSKLGKEWCEREAKKEQKDRHLLMQWRWLMIESLQRLPKDEHGKRYGPKSGIVAAYLQTCYDLYIARHHTQLQEIVLDRLKKPNNFQSARYELTIAATFIRAGCRIEYEDETDISDKHPEFIAEHKRTGTRVCVEAKSRHRPGVLGFSGETTSSMTRVGLSRLMRQAISKKTQLPYIVCFDLNLPPFKGKILDTSAFKEIERLLKRRDKQFSERFEKHPVSLFVFTNYAHHYGDDINPDPRSSWIISPTKEPLHPFFDNTISADITHALQQYRNIPKTFPDEA